MAMRSHVNTIGKFKGIGSILPSLRTQCLIDTLGQFVGNSLDFSQVVDTGRNHSREPAKARKQFLPATCAHALYLFKPRYGSRLGPFRPHAGYSEAVRLVTDLGDQHQGSRFGPQRYGRASVRKDEGLQAHLAPLPLRDPYDDLDVQAKLGKHLACNLALALAPVDKDQRRKFGQAV